MKKIIPVIIFGVAAVSALAVQQEETKDTCISCHKELDEPLSTPVQQLQAGVHARPQVSCVGCHGGDKTEEDAELAMSPAKGFLGKIARAQVPKLCAKCHSDVAYMRNFNPNMPVDQYERYLTSRHGQLLSKGDDKVATCTSCHGTHDIKKADDPTASVFSLNLADRCGQCHADADYMKGYSIGTDQLNEYKSSVHARTLYDKGDLSAPTCNDCHGNHGALPPGVTSIANVCGTCHVVQSEHFAASPHKSAFDELGYSECEACHGNHAIQRADDRMIGGSEPATCVQCHDQGSAGLQAAVRIRTEIDSLAANISRAEALFGRAQRAGVEIGDERLHLPNATNALTQARVLIHTFDPVAVSKTTATGLQAAEEAISVGRNALREVGHRRQLLAVMVVLTLLTAGFLILYIRARERRR